jgi:hypothetical protein
MNDSPDLAAVTQVQQQTWSKGDFAVLATLVNTTSITSAGTSGRPSWPTNGSGPRASRP